MVVARFANIAMSRASNRLRVETEENVEREFSKLERNILKFAGVSRVRSTLLGLVEAVGDAKRSRWLGRMSALGAKAA